MSICTDQHIHMRKKLYEDLCMRACHTLVVLMDAGEMQTKSMPALYILVTCFFYTALKPMAGLWLANANLGKAGLLGVILSTMLIKGLACRSARCASNPVDHGWILLSTA